MGVSLSLPPCLRIFLFAFMNARLAGGHVSRESPVSISILTVGVPGLQTFDSETGFLWLLSIQKQVFMHEWQVLYLRSHISSSVVKC